MHRVLKLRLNDFKQVPVVLYKKEGATALWLRMGQLLIGSLGAEIFCPQILWNIRSIVSTIKFFFWDCGWFEPTKSCLRQQSIILSPAMHWWKTWWWWLEVGEMARHQNFLWAKNTLCTKKYAWCAPKKLCAPKNMLRLDAHHQQTPAPGLTRYKRWLHTLRLGKFDWKDFCCIVDIWRRKERRVHW